MQSTAPSDAGSEDARQADPFRVPPRAGQPFSTHLPLRDNPFESEESHNPYASPASLEYSDAGMRMSMSDEGVTFDLASRGIRLVTHLIEILFTLFAAAPGFAIGMFVLSRRAHQDSGDDKSYFLMTIALAFVGILILAIVNWVLIAQSGQSLAKKITGIRIVRADDGSPPGVVHGVVLRIWVPALIGAIPYVGGFFSLVDALFIFGEQQRCVHDLIAQTRVVNAR
jgi:uncharacterized RDD family membrane protein YckC